MSQKRHFHDRRRGEQGSSLLWAMLAVGVVGSAGYYASQRSVNDIRAYDVKQASDMTETGNVSNLAVLQSLVRFPKPSCSTSGARDPACVPRVYFEPYVTGAPALKTLQGTADPTLWSSNGSANSFNLYTFNPLAVPKHTSEDQFTNLYETGAWPSRSGESLRTVANAAPPGTYPWANGVYNGQGTVVPVQADANMQADPNWKMNNTVKSSVVMDLVVPPPPPPQCKLWEGFSTGGMNAPYGLPSPMFEVPAPGATVNPPSTPNGLFMAFGMSGQGVFNTATLNPAGVCDTSHIPAQASSVLNDNPSGVNIFDPSQCSYNLTNLLRGGAALPPGSRLDGPYDYNGNDPFKYYVLTLFNGHPLWASVTNPLGQWNGCDYTGSNVTRITIRYRKPPFCAWNSDPLSMPIDGQSHPMVMWTKFAAWASNYSPTNNWVSGAPGYVNGRLDNWYNTGVEAGRDNGQGWYREWYDGHNPNPWGYVWGVDGQTATCGTAIYNGRNQYCSWHGRWVPFGACMTSGSFDGFEGWTSFAALPQPRYVDYGSVWECYALLYQTAGCQGDPAYIRTHPGCFTPDTEIRGGDGELHRIDQLHEGDYVFDPISKQKVRIKRMIAGDEKKDLIEYQADIGRPVTVTSGHPVPTERGMITASELQTSDRVLGADGDYHPLLLLRSVKPAVNQIVWNIELDTDSKDPNDRMLEANGFVVTGDFVEQQLVEHVQP